eukprot:TRINITY_DN5989_c0_g1_i10.p1 TRINITY_DN5989_c0_g1~~TRINITY_DN5989_c0_g1_i10.p1  ORF type:complete len:412 (-),score=106.36 TRINITY_DN5989_c0_g1_i10:322-1557(-)
MREMHMTGFATRHDATAMLPHIFMYETLDLDLPETFKATTNSSAIPHIVGDPSHSDHVYFYHSAGVHSASFPWLPKLRAQLSVLAETGSPGLTFTGLPPSSLSVLLNSLTTDASPSPVLGLGIITDPFLGYMLIARTNYRCMAVDLTDHFHQWTGVTASSDPSSLSPSTLSSSLSSSSSYGSSEASRVPLAPSALLRAAPAPLPKFTIPAVPGPNGTGLPINQDGVKFIMDTTQELRTKYVKYLQSLHAETLHRIVLLEQAENDQHADLEDVVGQFGVVQQNQASLEDKMARAREGLSLLSQRADILSQALTATHSDLSRAEKEYIKKIRTKFTQLTALKERVHSLSLQADRIIPSITPNQTKPNTSRDIDEKQLARMRRILEDEQVLISKTVGDVKKLKSQVDNSVSAPL